MDGSIPSLPRDADVSSEGVWEVRLCSVLEIAAARVVFSQFGRLLSSQWEIYDLFVCMEEMQ